MRHRPGSGGDVGSDDAEAEAVERPAHLGHGVPPVTARHAHHEHLIPGARYPHLSVHQDLVRTPPTSASITSHVWALGARFKAQTSMSAIVSSLVAITWWLLHVL